MKLYVTFLSSFEIDKQAADCTCEYRMNAILFFQMAMSILTLCAEGQFVKNHVNDTCILIWKFDSAGTVEIVRMLYTYCKKLSSSAQSINRATHFLIFLRLASFSIFRILALLYVNYI